MRSIASLGLAGGLVASVSPSVYAMAEEYDAEGIWVRNGYDNEFTSHMKNDSNAPLSGQFYYAIEDVESGRTDREHYGGLIYAVPKDAFKFSFEVRDLPYTGVKRIVGRTDHPNIRCEPSGNVVVASADQVYTK